MGWFKFLGRDGGMGDIMAADPERFLPLAQYTDHVLRGPSELSIAEREAIAAFTSGLNACAFCHGSHAAVAAAYGFPADTLAAMVADLDSAPVEARMRPLLAFVKKLTLTPSRMAPADAEAVFAAGWSERALQDAIAVAALFNLFNRMVEGHGVEKHTRPNWGEPMKAMLEKGGYQGRVRAALKG